MTSTASSEGLTSPVSDISSRESSPSPRSWGRRSFSPTPLSTTPKDFNLETVTLGESRGGTAVLVCQCGPECMQECCIATRRSRRSPVSIQSDESDETTPLLCTISRNSPRITENSIHCACHEKEPRDKTSTKARNKLIIACLLALFFMSGEIAGGLLADSLAILSDAAHMLSDFASFLISLFAIWVATRKPSKDMSFGWHRAEVLGAVVSVLIIWVVTGVLVYEAILRCIHQDFEINADIMLITACAGVFVNVFMMAVLHQHGHGHSHGGGHGHSYGRVRSREREEEEGREGGRRQVQLKNINVHAAFIHVLGDLIQSIGIVIAGYIIWFKPEWKLADPVCTFLFSILVLFSTINILKDTLRVLMEGTPKHINYESVKADLEKLDGVKHAHSLQIWSLTLNKTALAVHLALEPGASNQTVLDKASRLVKEKYGINQTTLQVEEYQPTMGECHTCQNVQRPSRIRNFLKIHQRNGSGNSLFLANNVTNGEASTENTVHDEMLDNTMET